VSVARGASGAGVGVVVEGSLGVVDEGLVFRGLALEGSDGGVIVYFVVMRVVEGRALRRSVDCVSHDWAVSR